MGDIFLDVSFLLLAFVMLIWVATCNGYHMIWLFQMITVLYFYVVLRKISTLYTHIQRKFIHDYAFLLHNVPTATDNIVPFYSHMGPINDQHLIGLFTYACSLE